MLPVSAWPPGPPGSSLSPFGPPICVTASCFLPKGAWMVRTTSNSVVLAVPPPMPPCNPERAPGTGLLPGQIPPNPAPPAPPAPPYPCTPWWALWPKTCRGWMKYNDLVECWRAWQRKTGDNRGPIKPLAGHRPPNWFGPIRYPPGTQYWTLVPGGSFGTVLADGVNVFLSGAGTATIIQAYSV